MQHRKRGVVADAREDQTGASRLAHLRLVDAEGNVTPVEMYTAEPQVKPSRKKGALEGFDWEEFNQRPAALQLLTIPQVAAIEGVCVWKIRQLDKAGAYPHATGDGKGRRIPLSDYVATRTPTTTLGGVWAEGPGLQPGPAPDAEPEVPEMFARMLAEAAADRHRPAAPLPPARRRAEGRR